MVGMRLRAVVAVVWAVAMLASGARAQCEGRWLGSVGQTLPGVNGVVRAMTLLADGSLVVGGQFGTTAGGVEVKNVAKWDGASWTALGGGVSEGGPGSEPEVRALTVLPNGDLIVGGRFGRAGGVEVNSVARWDGQRWHAMGSGVAGLGGGPYTAVHALVVMPGGDVIAGGSFVQAGGVTVNGIARWDGERWHALGTGVGGTTRVVNALLVRPDGELVAGGGFTSAGGVTANRIARWNGTAWSAIGLGFNGLVKSLALTANGELVAGGSFTNAGRVARWTGTTWAPLGTGVLGSTISVDAIALLPSGELVVGGSFTIAGGQRADNLAAWRDGVWRAMPGPVGFSGVSSMLVLADGDLLIGALGVGLSNESLGGLARWDGSTWSSLGEARLGQVLRIYPMPNGDLLATGGFRLDGLGAVSPIGRWTGEAWEAFAYEADQWPWILAAAADGSLLAVGSFVFDGQPRAIRLARWNGTVWTPLGGQLTTTGPHAPFIQALAALPNGDVVVGGSFDVAGGVPAVNVARWDGSNWRSLGWGLNGPVTHVAALPDGGIVAAGRFQTADAIPFGLQLNGLARWNGTAWQPMHPAADPFPETRCVGVATNGSVYFGGQFRLSVEGPRTSVVRWDGEGLSSVGQPPLVVVTALKVLADGSLLAAGTQSPLGFGTEMRIARWDGAAWQLMPGTLNGQESMEVLSIATTPTGELMFGGSFERADGLPAQGMARWTDSGVPRVAQQPARRAGGDARTVTLTARCVSGYEFAGPVQYQWRRHGRAVVDGPGGAAVGGGVVSGSSGQLPSVENGMTATLRISFAESADVGAYDVVFSTACGSVVSAAVEVTLPACGLADVVAVGGRAPADGLLTGDDFVAFIAAFAQGEPLADVCGVGGGPVCVPDGLVTSDDFVAFVAAFAQGCP